MYRLLIISILLLACFSLSSCDVDLDEDPEKSKSFLEKLFEEEPLTFEINDVPIKQSLKRILKIENCDSIEIIDGFDIKSSYGSYHTYFKYKTNEEYIFKIIRNLPLGERENKKNYKSHSEVNPISWQEIKGDMFYFTDTYPDELDFWQIEKIVNKKCFECIKPPFSHRLVITEDGIIYHVVRPLLQSEYFYKFNPQVQKLENMLDDSLADRNLRSFYIDDDFARDIYVYPIKFPYKIVQFESNNARFVCKDENYGCSFSFTKWKCNAGYISKFNFDNNYILLELADCFTTVDSNVMKYEEIKPALDKYVIINMKTCEKSFFKTYEKMCKKAYKLNYKGELGLITVEEYSEFFKAKDIFDLQFSINNLNSSILVKREDVQLQLFPTNGIKVNTPVTIKVKCGNSLITKLKLNENPIYIIVNTSSSQTSSRSGGKRIYNSTVEFSVKFRKIGEIEIDENWFSNIPDSVSIIKKTILIEKN